MTYYIYHIPGKKIGVTCDLNNRVTVQQGYDSSEYDVLESSEDVDYISSKEIELQREYGYKVDMVPYKNLKPKTKMNINITEQTTTFPCPVNKLKGQLFDNIGMSWETEHGKLDITPKTIDWIMKNVKTSMFNTDRSYVYNKAFSRFYDNNDVFAKPTTVKCSKKPLKMFNNIRDWADERGLYDKGDVKTQLIKLQEEMGELAKATLENDKPEIIDAVGDMVVVLTNLAHLNGVHIETCIAEAYNVISKRTGKMVNGTFVKDAN
jgi:NTP pyrophosphatase (non-canonical NTP hydrolase)|tara:strand:- start:1207 stop:1998 length:792 start_codon:yes stop_codon:yes gene_type:complete